MRSGRDKMFPTGKPRMLRCETHYVIFLELTAKTGRWWMSTGM